MDSMSGIFNPPCSKEFISAFRLTLSLPFQTNEYSKLLIFFYEIFLGRDKSCHWLCFPNGLTLHLFVVWRKDEQVNSYSSRDSL